MSSLNEQQNYPYLEQIVSNITQQNNSSYFLSTSLKIVSNDEQSYQNSQSTSEKQIKAVFLQPCSKHRQKKGQFYQTQYPWIRYCENCALNLALCGKKIQKCLSSQQMFNKIKLCDILKIMNQSIKQCQKSHQQHSILSNKLQYYRQKYSLMIGEIDKYVQQIMQIRNILQQSIQNYINKEIKSILQKQSLIIGQKMELINQKSKIQCNFVDLIGKQGENQTKTIISKCHHLLTQNININELKISQYSSKLNQNINFLDDLFNQKINIIDKTLKINTQTLNQITTKDRFLQSIDIKNCQKNKNQLQFQGKTLITDPSDQFPITQSGRMYTAYSTIQNSALISPCCQLNNSSQNILTENSQNLKKNRTALQLKSRCKSKSTHKKKIDLNVRQNTQNFSKIKTV